MPLEAVDRLAYVQENLASHVESEDIREAFSSLSYVEPSQRYKVFQSAAEATLGTSWSCQSLEMLLSEAAKEYAAIDESTHFWPYALRH